MAAYRRLALVPVLALTACGGDDGGDVPTPDAGSTEDGASQPGTPLTIDDLCGLDGAYVEFVDRAFSCTADLLAILDLELEPADLDAACDALFAPYVEDGSIELGTRDDLAACFAALDSLDCTTDDIRTIDECEAVVKGTVAGGDACEVDAQCAGDAYCDTSAGATCGLCRAREANGAACDDDDECAGRRCAGATANAAGTCRDVGLVDDSCDVDDDCAGSLRCSPSTGLCEIAPAWSVDDPCVPDTSDCGFPSSDLFCDDATDSCREFAGIGDTCAGGVAVCNFVKYEICDAGTGLCRAPQTSPEGGGCNMFTGVRCQAGLSCSQPFTGGTCVDPAVGSTCDAASPDFACGLLLECKPDNTCGYEADYTGTCP